ncbi:MAG TPA: hypothetical protein VIL46_02030, partial [Gemmataceae bacterium]
PNANDTVVFGGDRELRVTADGRKVIMLAAKKGGMLNRECVLTVWDAATGECLSHREAPWGRESCLTPDGTGVFTYDSKAGEVRLLDLDTAAVRARFPLGQPAGREWVMSSQTYAVSADGRILAARMRHRNLRKWVNRYDFRVWDVASGRELLAPAVEGEAEFALSSDGRLFALASAERLRLWETASCRPVGDIPAPDRDAVPPGQAFATALAVSPDGRTIATGHADSTILLWDATLRGGVRGGPLTPAGADALWADLAGADARRAYAALWRLADDPERSLPLLRRRLRPVTPAGPEVLRPLLRALDSSRFGEREAAERELRTLGDRARPDLLEALGANPSAEQRRRIEAVLAGWNRHGPLEGEALREVRAVQVLERIASAGAREFLEELAGGMESARLTREAKAALRRMEAR